MVYNTLDIGATNVDKITCFYLHNKSLDNHERFFYLDALKILYLMQNYKLDSCNVYL